MNKILAVYKPKGPTSHDLIDRIRQITGEKRVGHAGTLDPLASGVLVVGIGRQSTKKLGAVVKKEKEYIAIVKLGAISTTDDQEGEKQIVAIKKPPTKQHIQTILKNFKGDIKQTPPKYSAVKVKGQRAYKLARAGKEFTLKPKRVEIKEIKLIEYQWPRLKLKIITGPGVYIRSLARDIGEKLKTGGYLKELERTRVGDFTKEKAHEF